MDPSMGRPSPRRELQGPRPAPLRVRKDSYKIKKPPIAPPQNQAQAAAVAAAPPPHPQAANHRPPVIIYAVSPKIIHTKPGDFMSLVQRLTGPSNSDVDPAAAAAAFSPSSSLPSPAARLASIEKSVHGSNPDRALHVINLDDATTDVDQNILDRSSSFPGILSPLPSALPPISPSFFSPLPLDPSYLNFDLSPVFTNSNTTRSSAEGSSFLASPSNLLPSPLFLSPNACWDILTQFDL
ncbi:protein MKS1-like [Typha angustifolia]|uniref:protein MKS1-like n=1 Tax=Typha angustifolia TaxID=59011 RepID=UPI003C2FFD4F